MYEPRIVSIEEKKTQEEFISQLFDPTSGLLTQDTKQERTCHYCTSGSVARTKGKRFQNMIHFSNRKLAKILSLFSSTGLAGTSPETETLSECGSHVSFPVFSLCFFFFTRCSLWSLHKALTEPLGTLSLNLSE
ncbi:hypothetical protein JHK86_047728 [Glycine max]|nr:hypothetical protein JHK86_047728 [Glycine max]